MAVGFLLSGTISALTWQPSQTTIDDSVEIKSDHISGDRRQGIVIYSGNVVVTRDVTSVRADRVTIYFESSDLEGPVLFGLELASHLSPLPFPSLEDPEALGLGTRKGVAEGNVLLTDPDGTVKASRLEFNWDLKTGSATDVEAKIAGVLIKAREALIAPGRYELLDAEGTSCPDIYYLRSRRVVIRPAEKAVIERPRFSVGPLRLPTLPNQSVSMDQRVTGFRLPTLSFRRGVGMGITWNSGILLDTRTALTAGFNVFPETLPSYGLEIARSDVPPTRSTGLISPRSELSERFSYGYFENVTIKSPENEAGYLSAQRSTISLGSYWNQRALTRTGEARFSKLIDVAYERGGKRGDIAAVGQLRAQHIRQDDGPFRSRLVAQAAVGLKPLAPAHGLSSLVRLDLRADLSEDSTFGWARLQLGAIFQPTRQIRIGAAYMLGAETGRAEFEVDRLYSTNAFHARADLDLGPTKVSYLAKYDFERKKWYDREYSISQVMGCLEPYVLWRQFPSDYRIGLRLRIDDFLGLLSRRDFRRKGRG